jgi:plasmid stabilization system protein ParE
LSRVIITEGATQGLERCRLFLAEKNQRAAQRAGQTIARTLEILASEPEVGRPFDDAPELRELVIEFGDAGYIALYRYKIETNTVYILAFLHQKEAGY